MQPRTKLQKAVVEGTKKLSPLSQYQKDLAVKQCLSHIAKLSKGKYWCLDCGHSWKADKNNDSKTVICPHCGEKMTIEKDRKRKHVEKVYFATITSVNDFMVVRMFLLTARYKKGESAKYYFDEPFQKWIDETGRETIYGYARHYMGYYVDRWDFCSDMEIRTPNYAHSIAPYAVIGQTKATPLLKRNGFNGKIARKSDPATLIKKLLTDSRIETLIKANQISLAQYYTKSDYGFQSYWPSIKIAIRHKYIVKDASMWCDMLNAMTELHKDIHNPKFICPNNLKEAHDFWIAKRNAKREKAERERERRRQLTEEQRYMEDRKRVAKDEKAYQELKSRFFDIEIKDNDMIIKPLVSVLEFVEEGHLMHHCVFSNKYYERKDCLILHAIVDGVSVATIELNLESLRIIQCRGSRNSKPAEYDRIVSLIETNIGKIAAKRAA